jgi:sugar phosphate isomerase/epimerase
VSTARTCTGAILVLRMSRVHDPGVNRPGVPRLSWFPVRLIQEVSEGRRSESGWLQSAEGFGFRFVELHQAFVSSPAQVRRIESALQAAGLGVAMITGASDLVHPSAQQRGREITRVRRNIEIAARLGAPAVRVTAGIRRTEISARDGFDRIRRSLDQLIPSAEREGVALCFENHYRDRTWPVDSVDFAADEQRFLQLAELIQATKARINYDSAQPMVIDADELALLERVAAQVFHVHLGDRRRGSRQHSVLGEGDVRISDVLAILRRRGYDRFISIEDGNAEGDVGLERGLRFVRQQIATHWADARTGPGPS